MKRNIAAIMILFCSATLSAQETVPDNEEFDRKFRFGLRVTPQPTWFTSGDKNNLPAGATFGVGFGLNMEYRFSDVAGFLTGIGGDFEGGHYTFRNDPANNYEVKYYMNQAGEFVAPVDIKDGVSGYYVSKRTVSTTHVTIPLILKLSTQEYGGMKYFGLFGGELGIRVKNQATDSYFRTTRVTLDSAGNFTEPVVSLNETQADINIWEETSLVPLRFGLNAGLGFEYRLGGSTSAFMSINFFRSFLSQMRKTSDYTFYGSDGTNKLYIKQDLKQVAIRVNLGIMF